MIRLWRTRHLNLAAEIQWDPLPPLNYDDAVVSLAAALGPTYSVAGDSFDYAVDSNRVRFALFDAVGHGLQVAQMVSLAVGCCYSVRRRGLDLAETVEQVDKAMSLHFLDHLFVTRLDGEFVPGTGSLTFVNAGHPPPILSRHELAVGEVDASSRLPFWLQHLSHSDGYLPLVAHLTRGDRLLMLTDGITDARSPTGDDFGVEHLVNVVVQHLDERISSA